MRILRHRDVVRALTGRERDTISVIREAYLAHENGQTVVPHSRFLRPPGEDGNRFIALPALHESATGAAGIKWVASFPGNIDAGLPRASAVVITNSLSTGFPVALLEGSLISAQRTAASAALAAALLAPEETTAVTLFGCGLINTEVLRFLAVVFPLLADVTLFDTDRDRALRCGQACAGIVPGAAVRIAPDPASALAAHHLVSIATTASRPHLDLGACRPGSTLLHLSLRDIWPEDMLSCQNFVDDADHVCREQTSVFLAAEMLGSRDFISGSIGQLLSRSVTRTPERTAIFSPFGLGVLDVALAQAVLAIACKEELGVVIDDFSPERSAHG
jgi:N-[(2S)-2-amino-2-carboxyethyl]-L-glutamate dehydrogenase